MFLVSTHAQVSSVAETLLDRTLNALVDELAEEALRCFRQVKRFGMGGMLRVSYSLLSAFTFSFLRHEIGNARDRIHASDPLSLRYPICSEDAI